MSEVIEYTFKIAYVVLYLPMWYGSILTYILLLNNITLYLYNLFIHLLIWIVPRFCLLQIESL